jgi:alanine racemase
VIAAQTSSSYLELDEKQLHKNIEFIRSLIDPKTTLSFVVKGNAYGHGVSQMVPMAERAGITHFSVYGVEEALDYQKAAKKGSELMIMGYIDKANLPLIIEQGYSFFIYDIQQLNNAIAAAKMVGKAARIHVEVETGMNRTGMDEDSLATLSDLLSKEKEHLQNCGICTHLAGAESIGNYYRIKQQKIRFNRYLKYFKSKEIHFEKRHAACSAALIRFPDSHFDLVRVGILIYGFWPSQETLITFLSKRNLFEDPLTSLLSWKTKVMTLKEVAMGEYIGYGNSFMANRPMRIAIVPVGYAHGYARSLSNQGRVLIKGKRVGVIGLINMNMMAIDVTEIKEVKNGDEVVLIGFQGENRITVSSFSELSVQMNYELLARLPQNLPRIIS